LASPVAPAERQPASGTDSTRQERRTMIGRIGGLSLWFDALVAARNAAD
jgi:hypothetical protein